jgi:hypothetical protein
MSILSMTSMQFANPIGYFFGRGATFGNQFVSARVPATPLLQSTLAQVIFIIESEFFQARARHVSQL